MHSKYLISKILLATGVFANILSAAGHDQVEGTLAISVFDYFKEHRSETQYSIRDQAGNTYVLVLAAEPTGDFRPGMIVRSHGRINGRFLEGADLSVIDSTPSRGISLKSETPATSPTPGSLPTTTPYTGVQTTLIYNLVSAAPGASPPNFTNGQLESIMFATSGLSVNTYYLESSFNKVSFAGKVIGPYAIDVPTTCDSGPITTEADQSATAAGVDISLYPHHVYMMPSEVQAYCTYGGHSTIGGNPGLSWINTGLYLPINPDIYVPLTHELGHQLSLMHAQSIQEDGSLVEYGDNSCVMGDEDYNVIDFDVLHRIQEGWIPLSNILQVSTSGTYTVNFGEAQTNQVQALQVTLPNTPGNVYISYRQPIGNDVNLPPAFLGGATIQYWAGGITKSQLATNYPWGGALSDNETFTSADRTVSISQISHTSTSVTVEVTANDTTAPSTSASVSAASYVGGSLAAETISSAFGAGMATGIASASEAPVPESLLGTSVVVIDSLGVSRQAPLFFVSPRQVNYEMPADTALGLAQVSVISENGTVSVGSIQITAVSPGVFALNAAGLVAGSILRVKADGTQTDEALYTLSAAGAVVPFPVDLSQPADQVYLILYGTGIRGAAAGATTVTIGGLPGTVAYAGAQGTMLGLDQVNVLLPAALAGQGVVQIALVAGGIPANAATISIQ